MRITVEELILCIGIMALLLSGFVLYMILACKEKD